MSHPAQYGMPGSGLAPLPPPTRWDARRALTLAGTVGGIALCGIGVLVYVGWHIGPLALSVGIAAALLPVPLLVGCFLWLDRYKPKPAKYLAVAFAWGAGVATAASLAVNTLASMAFDRFGIEDMLVAVIVAPIVEETTKAIGPAVLFWRRPRVVNSMVDGIVLCGLSAAGFAMVENILYLGKVGFAEGSTHGGALVGVAWVVRVFLGRILMSGFAHPLFTAMTGIGLGLVARVARRPARWLAPAGGLLAAMVLHASWNLMATLTAERQEPYILLYGYVSCMMPVFFGMVGFVLWLRSAEGRLTERALTPYVHAGWLSPPEIAALGTIGRRSAARHWAKRMAGEAGARAMRAYQFEATRLALLRDGMRRGACVSQREIDETRAEELRLLAAIAAYRQAFTGRDPHTYRTWWDGLRYHVMLPDGGVRVFNPPNQPVVPVPVTFMPVTFMPVTVPGYPPR
ncbi:MAG: PrsW family intramembrane metalloprotease [Micromonosporaceae bacterium]|nr:PrsW family intramembrane metalloprotease [Micromonosporaceae bacterium]